LDSRRTGTVGRERCGGKSTDELGADPDARENKEKIGLKKAGYA
jgi:hypothetical protein